MRAFPVYRQELGRHGNAIVGFSNQGVRIHKHPLTRVDHAADWVGETTFHPTPPSHASIAEGLLRWAGSEPTLGGERTTHIDAFVREVLSTFVGKVPDATTLQDDCSKGGPLPLQVARSIAYLAEHYFAEDTELVDVEFSTDLVQQVPIALLAKLYAVSVVCEEINRGDLWLRRRHQPDAQAKMAGAFMATTYFWMRRSGANPTQALRCCPEARKY